MLNPEFLAILRCPRCGGELDEIAEGLTCPSEHHFDVVEGVPLLWAGDAHGSHLEEIDYDAVHGVNPKAIEQIGSQWDQIFKKINHSLGDVLELGAGIGALTKGLIGRCDFNSLIVTDISQKFLIPLREEIRSQGGTNSNFAVYDTNNTIFKDRSFDTIIGRSILHHILDYKNLLVAGTKLLKPGGRAIFFEPVLQGKALISLLLGMVLRAHENGWQTFLTQQDYNRLKHLLRHQTKSGWYPQNKESLAKIEDKYIFDVDALIRLGRSLGYRSVTYRELGKTDQSYWTYFRHTMITAGIAPAKVEEMRWVCDVCAETYGLVLPLKKPMGYFVFAM